MGSFSRSQREDAMARKGDSQGKTTERKPFERTQKQLLKGARRLADSYRIRDGNAFRLADVDPADTAWLKSADKKDAKDALELGVDALADLQDRLYAQDRWSLLLIFQA